jgi:hypothetical protein
MIEHKNYRVKRNDFSEVKIDHVTRARAILSYEKNRLGMLL